LVTPEGAGLSILLTLPLAMLVAGIAAFLIGSLSLRTRGFFFLMVTLAFGQMLFFVFHDTKIGGGSDGAYLARPTLGAFGFELPLTRHQRPVAIYYVSFVLLLAMYLGLARLMRSLFGRVLDGIRANEHRMQSIGFDTYRYKLAAFTLAGSLAGVAGHMWAMKQGAVNPELLSWHRSAEALLMILLGGLGSLAGPLVGALAFTGLGEIPELMAEWKPFAKAFEAVGLPGVGAALQAASERKVLVQGIVILIAVLALPKGIMGVRLRRPRRKKAHAAIEKAASP
ncbi:MAG: branched-chain amino acid ABC transporter permease, partial [Hyphomicrobiaceae bacterium]